MRCVILQTPQELSAHIQNLSKVAPFIRRHVEFGTLTYIRGGCHYLIDGLPEPYDGLGKTIEGRLLDVRSEIDRVEDPAKKALRIKVLTKIGRDLDAARAQHEEYEQQKNSLLPYVDELQQYVITSIARKPQLHPVVASELKPTYAFKTLIRAKLPHPSAGTLVESNLGLLSTALSDGNLSCSEVSILTQLLYQQVRDVYRVQGSADIGQGGNHAYNLLVRDGTLFLVDLANPTFDDEVVTPFIVPVHKIDSDSGEVTLSDAERHGRKYSLPIED